MWEQLRISPVQKIIIWLDCCYSGALFNYIDKSDLDQLGKDYCLITATRSFEQAFENFEQGLFTRELLEGLNPDFDHYGDEIVDSHKLAQFISKKMAQTMQAPQFLCSKRSIPLTTKSPLSAFQDECPYRSLSSFTEKPKDAQVFYGRTKPTQQLIDKMRNKERLIAVFGQSGSGKSSLLRAGLLHQLKSGQSIPGSNHWIYLEPFTPGDKPLTHLSEAFEEGFIKSEDNLPIILIIDQFEECFTMCDEEHRQNFIQELSKLLKSQQNLQIIIGMRSDFRSRLREYPEFRSQISPFNLKHLSQDEIREAIEKPAEIVGLYIQGSLKQELINDVEDYPGSLPLLQYTLTELWKETRAQNEKFLRLETYKNLGGIEGTLEKRADEVYKSLSEDQKPVAKRIFLELTQLGSIQDTRRKVSLQSLVNSHHSFDVLDEVAHILADRKNRLITRSDELIDREQGQDDTNNLNTNNQIILDVVHEALIRHWGQLREWQEQYRDGMFIERKIEDAAEDWLEKNRKPDYLWRGEQLSTAELYLDNYKDWGMLDGIGEEFIISSIQVSRRTKIQSGIVYSLPLFLGTIAGFLGIISIFSNQEAQLAKQAAYIKVKLSVGNEIEHLLESIKLVGNNQKFSQNSLRSSTKLIPEVQSVLYQAADNSREKYSFHNHQDSVNSVAIKYDSNYLVYGSTNGTVKLWDITNKSLVHTFVGHQDSVNFVAISSDGKHLVSGGSDKTVKLWDVANKSLVHTFVGHQLSVKSVAISSDNKYIISGSDDEAVKLWDIANQSLIHTFEGHKSPVRSVAINSNNKYIISGSSDNTVKLWDIENQSLIHTFAGHQYSVTSVAISSDSSYLVSGDSNGAVKLWDVENQSLIHTFAGHQYSVTSVAISSDHKSLISSSSNGTVKLWDVDNQSVIHTFAGHQESVYSVAISSDGRYLASGGFDKTVKLWDIANQSLIHSFEGHQSPVRSVAISSDGNYLVSGSWDKTVKLWDIDNQSLIHTFEGHQYSVYSVAISSDGNYLVSGGYDETVKLWDIANQSLVHTFTGHQDPVYSVAISPDGKYLVSGGYNSTIKLWDIANQSEVHTFIGHQDSVRSVKISSDSKYLVSGSDDKTVKLWNIANQSEVHTFIGHQDSVNYVAINPDSKYLVSGSSDDTVKLWDIANESEVHTFIGHQEPVYSVAISSDGKHLVSGSSDGKVKLWKGIHWQDWLESGCKRILLHPALVSRKIDSALEAANTCVKYGNWTSLEKAEFDLRRAEYSLSQAESDFSRAKSLVEQGLTSAKNSNLEAAQEKFRQAYKLDPDNVNLTGLTTEANQLAAEELIKQGLTSAKNSNLEAAQEKFRQAYKLDPDNVNLTELTTEANQLAAEELIEQELTSAKNSDLKVAQERLQQAKGRVREGDISKAITLYNQALKIDPNLEIKSSSWNSLCWFGGIYGYASEVLNACEKAVALADEESKALHVDSRGLARALTEDTQGAIEDFLYYVENFKGDKIYIDKRKEWIESLKRGENPFTNEVLEYLKDE
ncbi:MAG: hypothetical protein AAGA80_22340 [Cyanobacteria bacterium P01_F01_bin.143]